MPADSSAGAGTPIPSSCLLSSRPGGANERAEAPPVRPSGAGIAKAEREWWLRPAVETAGNSRAPSGRERRGREGREYRLDRDHPIRAAGNRGTSRRGRATCPSHMGSSDTPETPSLRTLRLLRNSHHPIAHPSSKNRLCWRTREITYWSSGWVRSGIPNICNASFK